MFERRLEIFRPDLRPCFMQNLLSGDSRVKIATGEAKGGVEVIATADVIACNRVYGIVMNAARKSLIDA